MSVCLRTVSNKLLPLNAAVLTRQPRSNGDTNIIKKSEFLEKKLPRGMSIGPLCLSLPCVAALNDCNDYYNTDVFVKGNAAYNWREILKSRCEIGPREIVARSNSYNEGADNAHHNVYYKNKVTIHNSQEYYPPLTQSLISSSQMSTSSHLTNGTVHFSSPPDSGKQADSSNAGNKANKDQLNAVSKKLQEDIPMIFAKVMDYNIYHPNLKFINNIKGGTTTVGLYHYAKQVAMVRLIGHIRFAYVKMDVLNVAVRPEPSTIVVRWRVSGVSGLKVMLMFWKYKLWKVREIVNEADAWYDGVSTFHVGSDSLIHTHVVDKVVPDDENIVNDESKTLAAKLAVLLGLVPRSSHFGELAALVEALNSVAACAPPPPDCLLAHEPLDKMKP